MLLGLGIIALEPQAASSWDRSYAPADDVSPIRPISLALIYQGMFAHNEVQLLLEDVFHSTEILADLLS